MKCMYTNPKVSNSTRSPSCFNRVLNKVMLQELMRYKDKFRFDLRLFFKFFYQLLKSSFPVSITCCSQLLAPSSSSSPCVLVKMVRNLLKLCPKNGQPTDVILVKMNWLYGFCDIICGSLEIFFSSGFSE